MKTARDLFDLSGRVALVTGGAGHIGSAIAEALAEQGAKVICLDLPGTWGPSESCITMGCDLSDVRQIGLVAKAVQGDYRRLDILVNCAAYLPGPEVAGFDAPLSEQRLEPWRRSFEVNLTAAFALIQACAPMLAATRHGSVINVASIYGMVGPDLGLYEGTGMGCAAAYAASKGGLLQLTRHLATVLAPWVRVNAITPGGVARGQDTGFAARYCARTPLGRMATEEDLIGAAVYLASDASAYVTGHNLVVDGGWTAW